MGPPSSSYHIAGQWGSPGLEMAFKSPCSALSLLGPLPSAQAGQETGRSPRNTRPGSVTRTHSLSHVRCRPTQIWHLMKSRMGCVCVWLCLASPIFDSAQVEFLEVTTAGSELNDSCEQRRAQDSDISVRECFSTPMLEGYPSNPRYPEMSYGGDLASPQDFRG